MQSVRRSLHLQRFISVKTETFWKKKQRTVRVLKINNPILTETDLLKIKNMKEDGFKVAEIPIIYYKNTSLEKAIDYLFIEVDRATVKEPTS